MKSLAIVARALSTMLDAGVDLRKACKLAAAKVSDPRVQTVFADIVESVDSGGDLETAFREQGRAFPRLFVDMVAVGEQTGSLPEVFRGLAEHYENNDRLKKRLIKSLTWPAIEFTMAVLIIALLILILGWIADARGGEPLDVLGWGLTGTSGALTWLTTVALLLFAAFAGLQTLRRSFEGRQAIDRLLLKVPVLGHCLRSFAIARFSWAYSLTQQAGMELKHSLRASLMATSNGAFLEMGPRIWREVQQGEPLSDSLRVTQLFPDDYVELVHVAETAGTVPEELHRLSPHFEDDARRSLDALVKACSVLVRVVVGIFIVFVIFSVATWYIGLLNDAVQQAM